MFVIGDPPEIRRWRWPALVGVVLVELWLAHAVAFFAHEYAHSFVAWLLGWKADPLGLHFPPSSTVVWLMQLGINQNVNETPIFASGHGVDAALIAAAGMVVGNLLITLPLSRIGYRVAKRGRHHAAALFFYLLTVASVGNVLDYIPIRTFTLESDMGSVQRGFGWTPWPLLVLFGPMVLGLVVWLTLRAEPATLLWLFPVDLGQRRFLVVITSLFLFGFYGAAGLLEGGPVSHALSLACVWIGAPAALVEGWMRAAKPA